MVSITVPLEPELKKELSMFRWINWSEVGREELIKKDIFERYLKTGEVTDKDWKFCEEIDWHPVDELPMKEGFIKELEKARQEPSIRLNSVEELFKR